MKQRARPAAVSGAAGFSADWLQQREPFDTAARDAAAPRLPLQAIQALEAPGPNASPLRVIDLACGTGANLRWLAPRLAGAQQWLVVDHDAALLQRWPACLGLPPNSKGRLQHSGSGFNTDIVRRQLDLNRDLESLPWQSAQLVTASALLDLVSAAWLQRLVAAVTAARAAVLMALTVDGRLRFTPRDADDATVAALFETHQQRDKGFGGPALGGAAAPALVLALRRAGYRVTTARSDWWLSGEPDTQAPALQRALIDGMAAAAIEQQPAAAATVRAWQDRRLGCSQEQAKATRSMLRVGHVDVLALPPR